MKSRITRRDFIKDVAKKGTALAVACEASKHFALGEMEQSSADGLKEAMFYEQLDGVMIKCNLEPRECIVNNWERGYCGARENRDGKYYSMVHARPCTVYVEPIEGEHFYHVHPGEQFFGIGTAGCNLGCKFCETWHISQVRPEETKVQNLSSGDAVRQAAEKGCRLLAFTYNDPVVCYEYTLETARAAKEAGLTTLCHTAGHIYTEPLKAILKYMDAINVDLKGFTDRYYLDMCGIDMKQVLITLETIRQENVMLEITNLVVPEHNDARQDIANMTAWIKANLGSDVPMHFSRFFPNYQLTDVLATPLATLDMAYDIARSNGLEFVYVGNVPGHERESTYCSNCNTKLIHRNGSEVNILELDETGHCKKCGQTVPGIWG
ncbi:AmmeMemoRadiSam system radical SAM enzyme [Candidatus Poribacteria bacterium]